MVVKMLPQARFFSVIFLVFLAASGLSACGGGGGGAGETPQPPAGTLEIAGGGVKGPLANATVTAYLFDSNKTSFKGTAVATGSTNANAAITDLTLPTPLTPPYILEFTSTAGTTTDITTGQFPVITTMRTVLTQALLDSGDPVYATPLTTMAVDIAVSSSNDNNGTPGIQADEFESALSSAATQVASTLGFGMDSSVDIFDTPPLVDSTTTSSASQAQVAAYRAAVEAVTAIAFQINENSTAADTDSVLSELAADLADGGGIDGSAGTSINAETLQLLQQDPATLIIPNTTQTVADVQQILVTEASTTAPAVSVTDLDTGGSITTNPAPAQPNPDSDGDGVLNSLDAFPFNPSESVDSDGDGIGDNADPDDDNDGILDVDEGTTPAPTASDTDGDGIDDASDNCPTHFNPAQTNSDTDAQGDVCDNDDDGDGVADSADAFPLDAAESTDNDGDGTGDNADTDDDNDGVSDAQDSGVSPVNGTTACSLLIDCDGDGTLDGADFAPLDPTVTINFAPVTTDDSVSADEDAATFAIQVTANDSDNDGNPNDSVSLVSVGAHDTSLGSAVVNGNQIDYTPTANANGSDTFTYTVSDGAANAQGSVTVTINAVNDAPVLGQSGPLNVAMDEDGSPTAFVAPSITATDAEGTLLSWSGTSAANGSATVSGTGASPTISYTPNANFFGNDSFTVSASDGSLSDSITINISVSSQNDIPVVNPAGPFVIAENTANSSVVGSVSGSDIDGSITGYSISAGNTGNAFAISAAGQISVANTTAIDFESASSFNLTVTATDGTDSSAGQSVVINITDVNDTAPVVTAGQSFNIINTASNGAVVGTVSASDADTVGSITNFTISGSVFAIDSNGQITVADNSMLAAGSPYTLSVDATDGTNTSAAENITITVVNNLPPVIAQSGPLAVTMDEDSLPQAFVAPTISASDPESDTLTWSTTGASHGTATVNGNGSSPSVLTYAPNANFNGSDSFVVNVSDGTSTVGITIDVTVNPQNDSPTITGTPASTATEGVFYSFVPGGGDIDTNDTLTYSISGQPSWASFNTSTGELSGTPQSGDADIYPNIVITVDDGTAQASLPSFNLTVYVTGGPLDITGVWDFEMTTSSPADSPLGCSNEISGAVEKVITTIRQTGSSFELTTAEGDQLSGGTINIVTGAINISGTVTSSAKDLSDQTDPKFAVVVSNDDVALTGSVTSASSMSGSITTTDDQGCQIFQSFNATFVYRHNGSENFNGSYAIEGYTIEESSDNLGNLYTARDSVPAQIEVFDDPAIAPLKRIMAYTFNNNRLLPSYNSVSLTNNTLDPETGYFSFQMEDTYKDTNSWRYTIHIHGIFAGDPASTPGSNGSPIVYLTGFGSGVEYSGDFDAGGTAVIATNDQQMMYGKRLAIAGYSNTDLKQQSDQSDVERVILGLSNPPLKLNDLNNSRLHFQILDGSTILCEGPYADITGNYHFDILHNEPMPDFTARQFRSGSYSSVSCNTSDSLGNDQVIHGTTYKLRVIDSGSDGVIDTTTQSTAVNDDIIQFDSDVDLAGGYQAEVVVPVERFSVTPDIFDLSVNGASTSHTRSGYTVPIYGYFDMSEEISVSWPAQESITTDYQLRAEGFTDEFNKMIRFNTTGLSTTIPANTLENYATLRLLALDKSPPSTPTSQARSHSRLMQLQEGVYGFFNIELGSGVPVYYSGLQVFLDGDSQPFSTLSCLVTNRLTNFTYCTGGVVDTDSDTVTLNMVDALGHMTGTPGSTYTLVLNFKSDGVSINSARAVVTSPDVAGIPSTVDPNPSNWVTEARAVSSEIAIRSQRFSDGNIQTIGISFNSGVDFSAYDLGILESDSSSTLFTTNLASGTDSDTGLTSLTFWNDNVLGQEYTNRLRAYTLVPVNDNNAQFVGRIRTSGSETEFGLGYGNLLQAGTYKGTAIDTDTGAPSSIFRASYTAHDPSGYIAPTLGDVAVQLVNAGSTTNCSAGVACDSANPVATGVGDAGSFNLIWTVTTPPAGSRWRIVSIEPVSRYQMQTERMVPDAVGSDITSIDNGNGTTTYTWTNPGTIGTVPGLLNQINIEVTSADESLFFDAIGTMISTDWVNITY